MPSMSLARSNPATQHAAQLVADVSVEFREGRLQQLRAPGAILVPLRQSGLARSSQHEQDRRFFRVAQEAVLTKAYGEIQRRVSVIPLRPQQPFAGKIQPFDILLALLDLLDLF